MEKIKSIPIQKYADGKLSNLGVNAQRVNPCPQCGHNDCCTIYKDSNSWYCYSCGSGGSVIDYVMAEQKMSDVSEAIKIIARDNGIILDKKFQENINKESKIQEIFNLATWYYNQILNKNNERLEYLTNQRKRTITQINKHNYGLSNGKLNQLLHKKGYTSEQILSSGLVRKKDNKFYDFFAPGFLVYPVYLYGKVSDFYAKKGKDSYQLPKDYKLRNVRFYGEEALSRDSFILVEGQEDRNTILQISDQYNVACILGNLTPDQINILAKKIVTNNKHEKKTVYCCFDNDHQGRKYLDKIADMFSHLCYLKVIEFPEEYKDIDEYLRQLPEKEQHIILDDLIKNAKDIIQYKIDELEIPENMNLKTAEGMYVPIVKLIAKEENCIVRTEFIGILADKFGSKSKFTTAVKNMIRRMRKDDDVEYSDEGFVPTTVYKKGARYWRKREKGDMPISNFKIKIKRYVEINSELHYEVLYVNINGETSKLVKMSKVDRINKSRFREFTAGIGSYYFSGNEDDLSEIWQIEEEEAQIEFRTCYFQRYGLIKDHNLWLFRNCAYRNQKLYAVADEDDEVITIEGVGYRSQDVFISGGDQPVLNVEDRPTKDYAHNVINLMWRMMDAKDTKTPKAFKGFLVMGFLSAVVYLQEITDKFRLFPYLLVYGEPETGKSECIQKLMNMMGFQNGGENWGEATTAGISMAMEQYSSVPYWLEEFSNSVGSSNIVQKKIELLKNIYNRTSTGKGGLDKRLIREVNASLVMTGQDRPENPALLSRCVILRKEYPTPANSEAFFTLQIENEYRRLSLVFRYLLENKTKEKAKMLIENIKKMQSDIKRKALEKGFSIKPRTTINIAIFAASFALFEFEGFEEAFLDWIVDQAIEDLQRKEKEDIVYKFFSDIESIYTSGELATVVKKDLYEGVVYLRFSVLYKAWVRQQRQTGMSEYISEGGLLDYLKRAPEGYWIDPDEKEGSHRVYINGSRCRAIALKIDLLPAQIKEIVDTWLEQEVSEGYYN